MLGFAILTPVAFKDTQAGFCFFFLSVSGRSRRKTRSTAVPSAGAEVSPILALSAPRKRAGFNWSWRAIRRGWEGVCSTSEGLGLPRHVWWWWHPTSFMVFELVRLVYPSRGTSECFACVASWETAKAVKTILV